MTPELWASVLALPLFAAGAALWRLREPAPRPASGRRAAPRAPAAVAAGFAAGLLAAALPTLLFGPPVPDSHDEFCYLLQAETFAAGRLTNPTPPSPRHFESPHLLLEPSYTGKYHPAQAAVLAAGLAATGSMVVGLWLQVGLFGAALAWMLRQWLPPRWALATAIAATAWCGAATYWGYSYWGGCVPAAAGALLLGAARRLVRQPSWRDGALLGAGAVGLALSRPFEGGLLALVAGLWMLRAAHLRRNGSAWLRAAAAASLVVALGGAALAFYDRAVTGDPWLLPYVLYERTYDATPLFVFQSPRAVPASTHAELDRYWRQGFAQWQSQTSLAGWLRGAWGNVRKLGRFFLGPALWLSLVALRLRSPAVRFALAALGVVLLGVLTISFCVPHYLAPATALVALLAATGLRRLRRWRWRGRPLGARLAAGVLLATLGVLPLSAWALGQGRREGWGRHRVELAERLRAEPGGDLVFVRFGGATIDPGWVYNGPDLDAAPIVWARTLGEPRDCELVRRLSGRRVWRVEVRDLGEPPRVVEEPAAACAAPTRE